MTRIAIIADIHGNLPALEAVTADIETQGVDEILVGGDLVGRGPQGSAVVHFIMDKGWPCIRGNHEDYMLSFIKRTVPEAWWHEHEWAASRWMAAELDEEVVSYIDALAPSLCSPLAPSLRLVHGSPSSNREGIGPWTSEEDLQRHLDAIDEPLLVCAHTHRPFDTKIGDKQIVNVGSVGLPFNGDWRAQYAIFSIDQSGEWDFTYKQVPYDRDRLCKHYEDSGFLEEGGVTSKLLYREVQRARPQLVPFLMWAERTSHPPNCETLPLFLDMYDDTKPMSELIRLLEQPAG